MEVSSHDGDDEAMFKKSENKGLLIILTTFEIINIEIKQILYFNILFYFFEYIFVAYSNARPYVLITLQAPCM